MNSIRKKSDKNQKDIHRFVETSLMISKRINSILKEKNMNQTDLATLLNVEPSLVSKWMQGTHNFSLKTISKIETILDEIIILTL